MGFVVSHLSKAFGTGDESVYALKDVSLTINDNEFSCIIGPSGCGKSTLLDILAGLTAASSGQVTFNGRRITGTNKNIGVVFQDPSLYPWRTILSNVGIGLELNHVKKKIRNEKVLNYLKRVGLAGFENKYPNQLSGGMKQRAGIARALVNEPKVLLMDEPFGALDYLTRLNMQEDLLKIWSSDRRTIVFVTHDIAEAIYLADRIVLLSDRPGRVRRTFHITQPRPRRRDDEELIRMQTTIYRLIKQEKEQITVKAGNLY